MSSEPAFDPPPGPRPVPYADLRLELSRLVGAPSAKPVAKALDIHTVGQMLHQFPRRYIPRGELTQLNLLDLDDYATILARVVDQNTRKMQTRKGYITDVYITDNSGAGTTMTISFFNGFKAQKELLPGVLALFSGKVSSYREKLVLTNPEYDMLPDHELTEHEAELQAARPIPVYPATAKFPSWKTRLVIEALLPTLDLTRIPDPVPAAIARRERLMPLAEAYEQIHQPSSIESWPRARKRFRFQEALALQTSLAQKRHEASQQDATGRPRITGGLLDAFDAQLPYTLTAGQADIGGLISDEIAGAHPMHRLLQGEVGSGKTVIALRAMLQVIDAGGQAAFLAPTEVLAAQHLHSIQALLGSLGEGRLLGGPVATQVTLLTGSMPTAARKRSLLAAVSGEAGIVIGTHALLSDNVHFADLGLIVVDEQHRFGVEQRDALRSKALKPPHLLVMTATPIPRTVAMTVFGDLEVSELTELPAGRAPIKTHLAPLAERPQWFNRVWERSREEIDRGHQVYVVCPKIGDGDEQLFEGGSALGGPGEGGTLFGTDDGSVLFGPDDSYAESAGGDGDTRPMAGVLDVVQMLRGLPVLADKRIEPLHGRLDSALKQGTMAAFAAGEIDVLVSTTVIEVGVDVHNATLMVIMDADRFGMSQLHQLRGRVGRGGHDGTCLLVTNLEPGHPSRKRLEAVAATTDGFVLAREDLELRREGDILGAKQSGGSSGLRMLSVLRDEDLIDRAREDATAIVAEDPLLERHPALKLEIEMYLTEQNEAFLERG
ncbi:ATP-dependent DNA helicase RecG [Arthrobacter stackebrandtii]|uniref:Probable DNA 3'-5' helicase RecG n=1 Tax=Arthrobacter stackebrandtii TaxID=272161 RepID=A0ABS4YZ69_9MICC|nr:ATP-dependent DNA helicase RecG [Arthrobacter stackebrandtii]MBP2414083.1 ATP-dependent DNA helicase RecG [Arthrobacter stackebrandtii]PYG99372.1 ATP-dependent DNA helicase RecG [Arthrobacter stackebrandtii]